MSETTQAPPATGTFCWRENLTHDVDKAKSFYTGLFGWTSNEMDMGPAGIYTMFKQGDVDVCGMMKMPPEAVEQKVPSHWLTYVAVDDCNASAEKAQSLGAKIVHGPAEVTGMGRFAIIEDPTGAVFAMWQCTASSKC